LRQGARFGERDGQGVLPAAGTDNQNIHAGPIPRRVNVFSRSTPAVSIS
jgi:hypothetical protein